MLAGAYHSVFKGGGLEFEEVRPYVPGDDVRTIDWNVTARMGEPFVKRYVEERELTVLLMVDTSPSLDFGSASRTKRAAATELSALLAFSAIANEDKVGLLLFQGQVDAYIPPRKGQKHALRVVREVLAHGEVTTPEDQHDEPGLGARIRAQLARLRMRRKRSPDRQTNLVAALEFCRRVLPRRAVIFLISDYLDAGYWQVLRNVQRRHDVVAVLVTDPRELSLEPAGVVVLEDAETGARRVIDASSQTLAASWARAGQDRLDALSSDLRASGIDLIPIDAAQPVLDPLLRFLRMRQRRIRR